MTRRMTTALSLVVLFLAACSVSVPPSAQMASPSPPVSGVPTPIPLSTAGLATYPAPAGFVFSYPADWRALDVTYFLTLGFGSPLVFLSNFPIDGCGTPADLNCLNASTVPLGGVLVNVGGASGTGSIFDPSAPWTTTIDGMPARSSSRPGYPGVDELRDWVVAAPDNIRSTVVIEATIRGPSVPALDAQVDALAQSIRFTTHPAPLIAASSETVLRTIVDYLDRDAQKNNQAAFYNCFPRRVAVHVATITKWWGEVLAGPTIVTCTSAIEPTDVSLWRITLSIRWASGPGYDAGEWREAVYADAGGTWIGQEELTYNIAPVAEFGPTASP